MIKILFLAANPSDTTRLRLDEESRAIDQALRRAEFRDKFNLRQHWAVRVGDIQELLLWHQPDIVHFCGHGSESSEIILEDETGQSHPVSVRALSTLFSVLKDNIRCVVLNACYSELQAQAIAEHIDCVVGMSKAIGDKSAIGFAAAFYQALGFGRSVKTAFELGCVQIDLESLSDQDVPQLLAFHSDPSSTSFAGKSRTRETERGSPQLVTRRPSVVPRKASTDVIVVESDLSFAELLTHVIDSIGYTSTVATYDPEAILGLAKRYQPRAVLGSAWNFDEARFTPEWFEELRRVCPAARIIGLEAGGWSLDSEQRWKLFDRVLLKPLSTEELIEALRE